MEAVVGAEDDSKDTSSDKENSIPSILPSSSPRLQFASGQLEDAPDLDEDEETSHGTSISSSESSDDEGPWVMGVDHRGDIHAYHVSSVPFNVRELREAGTTPSIDSGESELDDTSPLFQKPSVPIYRPARAERASLSSPGEADGYSSIKPSLNIWRDGSNNANSGGKPKLRRKPGMVFKDVSNTRQLLRNVHGTEIYQDPAKENKESAQTQNNTQHVPRLRTSVPYLQTPFRTPRTEVRQHGNEPSEYIWTPIRDPVRAAHFAATLAVLEGGVFPTPGTPEPLIRCARQEYGPDVLLDWPQPPLLHPRPIRPWLGEKAVRNLEEQVASADRTTLSAETIRSARQEYGPDVLLHWPTPPLIHPKPIRPWLGEKTVANLEKQAADADRTGLSAEMGPQIGPSQATPDLLHYTRIGTFDSKQKVENSKNQAAGSTWTSFFARAKPQMARPTNPSPDAARYHQVDIDGY